MKESLLSVKVLGELGEDGIQGGFLEARDSQLLDDVLVLHFDVEGFRNRGLHSL